MNKAKSRHANHSRYDLQDDMTKIRAILGDTIYDVKGKAGEMFSNSFENAKEKTKDFQKNIEGYTQEQPTKALGIAFLAGLVVGYLFLK